jgi:hypothetical protein
MTFVRDEQNCPIPVGAVAMASLQDVGNIEAEDSLQQGKRTRLPEIRENSFSI